MESRQTNTELPEVFLINGKLYTIQYLTMPGEYLGEVSKHKQHILIDSNAAYDTQIETIIHEILHVVFEESNLTYALNNVDEDDIEEVIVDCLAKILTPTLRSNPLFFLNGKS